MTAGAGRTVDSGGPGALLRGWRQAAGLSQEELADRAGLGVRTVRDLELAAVGRPRPRTLQRLADALGLDAAEHALLVSGRAPSAPAPQALGAGESAGAVRCLPAALVRPVGREDVVARLVRADAPAVLVHGPVGAGTTTVLVAAAHRAADRPRPGPGSAAGHVVYVDLADLAAEGAGAGRARIVRHVVTTLTGSVPVDDAEALAAWRRLGGGLLVVDGVRDAADIADLAAAGSADLAAAGSAWRLLLGSRGPLPELGGVLRVPLGPLPRAAAVALLREAAGEERADAEPQALADVVTWCDGLPLALRVVAARLASRPTWPVSAVVHRLRAPATRAGRLRAGGTDLRAVLDAAAAGLPETAMRVLARGGAVEGPWAAPLAARGLLWPAPDGHGAPWVGALVAGWAAHRTARGSDPGVDQDLARLVLDPDAGEVGGGDQGRAVEAGALGGALRRDQPAAGEHGLA